MLKTLRWKLTFLYLFIAIGLVAFVGLGTYLLIERYFQQTTDLALQYKMASQFQLLNLPLPSELAQAAGLWLKDNHQVTPPTPTRVVIKNDDEDGQDSESDAQNPAINEDTGSEHAYDECGWQSDPDSKNDPASHHQ
jgi:hypothetical protein